MGDHQVIDSRCETETTMEEEEEEIIQDSALLNLPVEIFLHICSFLDARFISTSLCLVCRQFNEVLSDESVWKSRIGKLYSSLYPAIPIDDPDEFDWREACAYIEYEHNLWHNKEKDTKKVVLKDVHYASVDAVLLMKAGGLCFSGSRDHNIVAWELPENIENDPSPKKVVENAHRGWIWNLESVDNKLFSCSWDATVKAWDVEEDLKEAAVYMCEQPALAMACTPVVMAVGLFNRCVMLFDPRTSEKKVAFYKAHTGAVLAVAMVDGYIVSASEDRTVVVWDHRACRNFKRINFSDENVGRNAYPMCLSYNNDSIYIGDVRGQVHLMDPKKGEFEVVETYNVGHTEKMTGIRHTAGSVMTCSSDGTMRILAPTRKLETIAVLRSRGGEITNFDYKNNVLAMSSTQNFVEVWLPKSE